MPPLVVQRVGVGAKLSNCAMSVPATNALPPAPRRINTRIVRIRVGAFAGVDQRLIHLPRHRVARLRPVEGERGERTADRVHAWLVDNQSSLRYNLRMIGPRSLDRLALDGVRVLDVTQFMAGPFCSVILADLGADVIKIEPPGGESTRQMVGAVGSESPAFNAVNRGKRSVVLNLKLPEGRDAFVRMARSIDIVIENNRPGVMRKLGLDYETLAATNPRLIYASISGYGQTGPDSAQGRIRSDRAGRRRHHVRHRRTGPAAGESGHPADRSRRGALRADRHSRGAAPSATAPGAVSGSRRRSWRPASRCRCGRRRNIFPAWACPSRKGRRIG